MILFDQMKRMPFINSFSVFCISIQYVATTAKTSSDLKIVDLAVQEPRLNLMSDPTSQLAIMRNDPQIKKQIDSFIRNTIKYEHGKYVWTKLTDNIFKIDISFTWLIFIERENHGLASKILELLAAKPHAGLSTEILREAEELVTLSEKSA